MNKICKYGISLRLVEVDDAEFILTLRKDPKLSRFISYTSPSFDDQKKWIQNYKVREKSGREYYFIAEDLNEIKYGTVRLYNINAKSFEIGSWIFKPSSPLGMAVKAHFIAFESGFEILNAEYCRYEIRKKNIDVLRYMENFNALLINEDDLNFYFTLSKDDFYKSKNRISYFSNSK